MKKLLFLMVILIIGFSCSHGSDNIPIVNVKSDIAGVLSIESIEQMQEFISAFDSMNLDEMAAFEDAHGYQSWGKYCEEVFFGLDTSEISDTSYVLGYIASNSNYLELRPDSGNTDELETKYYNCFAYYLMNQNRIYLFQDTLYKVFDDGLLYTGNLNNYSEMIYMDEDDLDDLEDTDYSFFLFYDFNKSGSSTTDLTYNCGNIAEYTKSNEDNRLKVCFDFRGLNNTNVAGGYSVKPQHKYWVGWLRCRRTVNQGIVPVRYDFFKLGDNLWDYETETYSEVHEKTWGYSNVEIYVCKAGTTCHFGGYSITVDTPDIDPLVAECNESLF